MKVLQGYKTLLKGLILLSIFGLAGCGVGSRVGDQMDGGLGDMLFSRDKVTTVQLKGDENLNPDPSGKPLSVVVRIYQLNAVDAFRNADMAALWSDSKGVLGESLLSERTVTVVPKGTAKDSSKLSPDAQFIGVAAFFRNSTGAAWHVAFSAQALRKDGILFSSDGVQLTLKDNRINIERGTDVLAASAAKKR
ncbi:type VI secretion system lipoprotein TssJ [Zymobacter sp. IVIA_5232.4 C2]|uniref:type VI secretion system lipoprotein TssJ n=1 Tax=Zymobacter sp. IVIA_5232.4 C2 TaxID=3394855 RepID=UPI0039C05BCE